ncbi:MAG TPA: 30S ribosomal protein S6 [Solirubrobacteraceae bacterium]|jgi:small subunit ribosomal protein S6|nr:30S ribosomal protein S6 [Solirubrobacteraceae bacterium]
MSAPAPLYDLMLLLNPEADEAVRSGVLNDVRKAITDGGGELVGDQDWGERPTAYPIDHRGSAQYHLYQFHGPTSMLPQLDRMLRISDGVMRYRVVRLAPGTPPPPDQRPARRPEGEPVAPAASA